MWVVADEDYDQTLVEYALLAENDRLEGAAQMDRQYHFAKLVAAAFNDPERIWAEHEEYRAALIRPAPERPAPTFDDVVRIHRRMQAAGLVPPTTGVMN